jgi:cation transport regulator ChaC
MIDYFAYGSCMDEDSFAQTVGWENYRIVGRAILVDYSLVFNWYNDRRQGGVADVIPAKGEIVEGVLYQLKPEALPPLDEREGVSRGIYRRVNIVLSWEQKCMEALTYTVVDKAPTEFVPSREYAQLIYNGAKRFLSDTYRKQLIHTWEMKFGLIDFESILL